MKNNRKKRDLEYYSKRCEQLEKALQRSEERFQKIFHASSNPMTITTIAEGRFVDLNEADARFGGFKREELIGRTATEFNLWQSPEERNKLIQAFKDEGKVHNLEVDMRTKSGDTRTVLLSADPIEVDDGPCLLTVAVDLTEQRKKTDALRESEEKYRSLVENSLQGIVIFQDFKLIYCNQAMADISGYTVDEIMSLSDKEISESLFINGKEFVFDRQRDRLEGKDIPSSYECRGIRKDGKRLWLEVCANVVKYRGKPAVQCAVIDITELKEANQNLQKALDWQNAVFEGSRDAIFISDTNLRFVSVNEAACRLTSFSKDELLSMGVHDLNKEKDCDSIERLRDRILTGEDVVGEAEIIARNGQRIDAEFAHMVVNVSGTPYIHTSARDISSRKRLEAQLQHSQKMEAIGVLAGGIAHDFNNLLTVINGYSSSLVGEIPHGDPKREDLAEIHKAGLRAASMTSQLLAFSRKQIIDPESLNLNDVIEDTNKILRRLIGEDITLSTNLQPDLGIVNADRGQIQQVIMNLAVNARDAMPRGGKLTIETANAELDDEYAKKHPYIKTGSYAMISVSDNGIGMDAKTREHIFDPFFTTKGKDKGTGLGLSTAYGIIKQSNGYIWVYSEPGKGTTFRVFLPCLMDKVPKPTDNDDVELEVTGNETILMVEDDPSVQNLVDRILEKTGYNVIKASSPKEALTIGQDFSGKIDLILTDVIMPEMNGMELSSQIKDLRPSIKTLYMSGYTDDAIVNHGILKSNVMFIQKPFTKGNLSKKIRQVLDSDGYN